MKIRRLNKSNLEETIELVYKTSIQFKISNEIKTEKDREIFIEMFSEEFQEMELFGYFINDKLVGVIGLEDKNYITILYVLKEYQYQHIGTKLLDYVVNYIKNDTDILDVCSVKNAIEFYQNYGFKRYNNEEIDKVMMKLNIKEKENGKRL